MLGLGMGWLLLYLSAFVYLCVSLFAHVHARAVVPINILTAHLRAAEGAVVVVMAACCVLRLSEAVIGVLPDMYRLAFVGVVNTLEVVITILVTVLMVSVLVRNKPRVKGV